MKCQYQAVISTTIRRDSSGLCSREALAAQSSAIIPPARCIACAIVSRNTNELLGIRIEIEIRCYAARPMPTIGR